MVVSEFGNVLVVDTGGTTRRGGVLWQPPVRSFVPEPTHLLQARLVGGRNLPRNALCAPHVPGTKTYGTRHGNLLFVELITVGCGLFDPRTGGRKALKSRVSGLR